MFASTTASGGANANVHPTFQTKGGLKPSQAAVPIFPPPFVDLPRAEPPTVQKSCRASKNILRAANESLDAGPDLPPLLIDGWFLHATMSYTPQPNFHPSNRIHPADGWRMLRRRLPKVPRPTHPPSSTTTEKCSNFEPFSNDCVRCVDRLGGITCYRNFPQSCRELVPTFNPLADTNPTNLAVFPVGPFSVDFGGGINNPSGDGGQQE